METIFIIFMAFASLVCLFAISVILRDVVLEMLDKRKKDKAAEAAPVVQQVQTAPVAEVVPAPQPQTAPEATVAVVQPVQPVEEQQADEVDEDDNVATDVDDAEGNVVFSASVKQTLEEKYLELGSTERGYYDEIVKYAANVEGARRFKNTSYEEYKIGKNRIVRLSIKRGVIHCEFMLPNTDFQSFVSENKIRVKQSATVVKVTDADVVAAVKTGIDVAAKTVAEEKERKKQLAREKRREKRNSAE